MEGGGDAKAISNLQFRISEESNQAVRAGGPIS
jgi:hypothetical protein